MEHLKNIANGIVIPIALVGLVVGGIFYLGRVVQKVEFNETAVAKVETQIKEIPSRQEFVDLKGDVGEIKKDVKSLLQRR